MCTPVVSCLEKIFTGTLKILQYIFFLANLLLWIAGMIFLVFDLYLIINRFVGIGEVDVIAEVSDYLGGDAQSFKIVMLIASILIGVFELFAFTGCKSSGVNLNCLCFKTGKKSSCGLTLYGVATTLLGLGLIVGSSFLTGLELSENLSLNLANVTIPSVHEYDLDEADAFTKAIVKFQGNRECCGISFNNTNATPSSLETPTCGQWQSNQPYGCECVPDSENSESCLPLAEAADLFGCSFPYDANYTSIYVNGCAEVMTEGLEYILEIFTSMAYVVGIFMILAGLTAVLLCCALRTDDEQKKISYDERSIDQVASRKRKRLTKKQKQQVDYERFGSYEDKV